MTSLNVSDYWREAWRVSPVALASRLSRTDCMACLRPGAGDLTPHSCFLWPDHVDYLSGLLVEVAMGRLPKLIVTAPPRHGKSTLISKWFPTWFFETFPHKRIILGAYEEGFAARWGRQVRNTVAAYRRYLTVRISKDSKANSDWETTEGGGMKTAGVGGAVTGRGGDILILDDPIKNWEQANSLVYRDRLWDFFDTTFRTRAEPGAGIVLDMTRWHEDDLVGRLMESEEAADWRVVNLAAVAEEGDPMGRAPGTPLWPERFPLPELLKIKKRDYTFRSLYQGHPPSLSGSLIYGLFNDTADGGNLDASLALVADRPLHLSLDFNIDPGMHGIVGQHFNEEDEDREVLTAVHGLHGPRWDVRTLLHQFRNLIERVYGKRWLWSQLLVYGDASGSSQWAGTGMSCWDVVRQALDSWGIPYELRYGTSNPDVGDRVHTLNAAFVDGDGLMHYLVHPRCTRLRTDFRKLKWEGNEIGKKDKKLSHPSDAEGYRVFRRRPIRRVKETPGQAVSSSGRSALPGASARGRLVRPAARPAH